MSFAEVTIKNMLDARENRAAAQAELLSRYSLPLISFTMNIAGELKRSLLSDFAFRSTRAELLRVLGDPVNEIITDEKTGLESLLVYDRPAEVLKEVCLSLEESSPAGRLFDLDVLGSDGIKLSRDTPRRCLICGGPVQICARSRAHGLNALKEETGKRLRDYCADKIAQLAVQALLDEVTLSPKPGLVDFLNSGAHQDMDYALLVKSAEGLFPWFRFAAAGGMDRKLSPETLRYHGMQAEKEMLLRTGGVNTHKGALYILGLLCYSTGCSLVWEINPFTVAETTADSLQNYEADSHGEFVRLTHAKAGPREEAIAGFPSVAAALSWFDAGDSPMTVFLKLMSKCEDSNLLHRGGDEGLFFAREAAQKALALPEEEREAFLTDMNEEFVKRNLSPGGTADLLSASLFMRSLQPFVRFIF